MKSRKLLSDLYWEDRNSGAIGSMGRGSWESVIRSKCGAPMVCPACLGEGTGTKKKYILFGKGVCRTCGGKRFVILTVDGLYIVLESCDKNGKVS